MPVPTPPLTTRLACAQYIQQLLVGNQGGVGLTQVYDLDDGPMYPNTVDAAVVQLGTLTRSYHGTRALLLSITVNVILMHGGIGTDQPDRQIAQATLTDNVVALLHSDMQLSSLNSGQQGVLLGFVKQERPFPFRMLDGSIVKATGIVWEGEQRKEFTV